MPKSTTPARSKPKRPGMIPLRDAAQMIGYSIDTVRRLARAGEMEWFTAKDNGWMLIDRASVLRFIARRRHVKNNGSARSGKDPRRK